MRLSTEEISLLKEKVQELSPCAKIFLFGSRVDDTKKGGDIDLLVLSNELTKKDLRYLRLAFFEKFGEQKMDIILDDGSFNAPFLKLISQKAIPL